jgi:hypothetical protein
MIKQIELTLNPSLKKRGTLKRKEKAPLLFLREGVGG